MTQIMLTVIALTVVVIGQLDLARAQVTLQLAGGCRSRSPSWLFEG
jgi:hypothetical protein